MTPARRPTLENFLTRAVTVCVGAVSVDGSFIGKFDADELLDFIPLVEVTRIKANERAMPGQPPVRLADAFVRRHWKQSDANVGLETELPRTGSTDHMVDDDEEDPERVFTVHTEESGHRCPQTPLTSTRITRAL